MSEIETDFKQLCEVRNEFYLQVMAAKDAYELPGIIAQHMKKLDAFLISYGATPIKKPED